MVSFKGRFLENTLSRDYFLILILVALVLTSIAATFARNSFFLTPTTLWMDSAAKSPGKRRPIFNYGFALYAAERYDQSLKYLIRADELPPDVGTPFRKLKLVKGNALFFLKKYDAALNAWQSVLLLSPDDPEILNNTAMALLKLGRLTSARVAAEKASTYASEDLLPDILLTKSQILMQLGDIRNGKELLERVLHLARTAPEVYLDIALYCEEIDQRLEARQYALKYLRSDPTPVGANKARMLLSRTAD